MTLLERVIRQNPWWEKKEIEEIKEHKERFLFKKVWSYFQTPQIIAVTGMRRTGKTVLLLQIIKITSIGLSIPKQNGRLY